MPNGIFKNIPSYTNRKYRYITNTQQQWATSICAIEYALDVEEEFPHCNKFIIYNSIFTTVTRCMFKILQMNNTISIQ